MNHRRLVGIDLGITSAHTVRVLDGEGNIVAKRKAWPTAESLSEIEAVALAGCPAGTRLEVVMEPTGPAWLPIAVFFAARGHAVHRVSSAKAADLRRFLSRHTKTNGIDADTLARLPLFDPAGLQPLELPGPERAALDRRVRATDRLTAAGAEHKRRIKDLVRQLMPMSPLSGDLGAADLAVLERWADPNALVKAGAKRLAAVIAKASKGHHGAERPRSGWPPPGRRSTSTPATRRLPSPTWPPRSPPRCACCGRPRPNSPPTPTSASTATASSIPPAWPAPCPGWPRWAGRPWWPPWATRARFRRGRHFRSYTGLAPKASETGESDRKGEPMSKAGSSLLRTTMVRAADNARRIDPQLARIYWIQMTERGKGHLGALCVVAANLAERAWAVMDRGMPYVICDTDGRPVTPAEARSIIAEHWTVSPDVRARRRSKKVGKAPKNVHAGRSKPGAHGAGERGDLPRQASSDSRARGVKDTNTSSSRKAS